MPVYGHVGTHSKMGTNLTQAILYNIYLTIIVYDGDTGCSISYSQRLKWNGHKA